MLRVVLRRVADGEVERLRWWMGELMRRREEVVETFENEGVRHEMAYLLALSDGPAVLYLMEVEDPARAGAAFRASTLPIDQEHKEVMRQVLGEPVEVELLYDVRPANGSPEEERRL